MPKSGRYSGGGLGHPLQYSCLGKSVDSGAWRATVMGSQNQTRLKWLSTHTTEGHCGCIQVLAIMNKTVVNILVQVFVWMEVFNSELKPRSAITRSHGRRKLSFYKKLPNCLPKWLDHFAFPPAVCESSHCAQCGRESRWGGDVWRSQGRHSSQGSHSLCDFLPHLAPGLPSEGDQPILSACHPGTVTGIRLVGNLEPQCRCFYMVGLGGCFLWWQCCGFWSKAGPVPLPPAVCISGGRWVVRGWGEWGASLPVEGKLQCRFLHPLGWCSLVSFNRASPPWVSSEDQVAAPRTLPGESAPEDSCVSSSSHQVAFGKSRGLCGQQVPTVMRELLWKCKDPCNLKFLRVQYWKVV